MEEGQIVEAKVYRTEFYGLFLRYGEEELFVHLPEIPDHFPRSADHGSLLDSVQRVRILRKHPNKNQWISSLRF
jgi:predicted RNA-binding protein with RPS1 domain